MPVVPLCDEMDVCVTILRMSGDCRPVPYDDLIPATGIDPKELSAIIDYLTDLGMVEGSWVRRDGVWSYGYGVTAEAEGFVESALRRSVAVL